MIKINLRAIVATKTDYVLMGEPNKEGKTSWDLPGGELQAGKDFRQLLQKLVLQNTGYRIKNLSFFEIVCNIVPRGRGQDPITVLDFIFTSELDGKTDETPQKEVDLFRFDQFEWLESEGRYRLNKVMSLLSRYHGKIPATHNRRLHTEIEPNPL